MGWVLFGEDLEGEVKEMADTLTIVGVEPCNAYVEGHYDFYYQWNDEKLHYKCVGDVDNGYHAVNRAINRICEEQETNRSLVDIVRLEGYDRAIRKEEDSVIEEPVNETVFLSTPVKSFLPPATPEHTTETYTMELYVYGWSFNSVHEFPDFFFAVEAAESVANSLENDVYIKRNGYPVATVSKYGKVSVIS